jgi:hypothetical protein
MGFNFGNMKIVIEDSKLSALLMEYYTEGVNDGIAFGGNIEKREKLWRLYENNSWQDPQDIGEPLEDVVKPLLETCFDNTISVALNNSVISFDEIDTDFDSIEDSRKLDIELYLKILNNG